MYFIKLIYVALLVVLLSPGVALATTTATSKPNIIIILSDDLGMGDVACYGQDFATTPNIDKLASQGTRFERYYTPAPICSPSRAGMLTGQFPGKLNLTSYLQTRAGNRDVEQVDFLDARTPTMPRTFQQAGYATAHVGKWHLGGGRDVDNAPKIEEYGYDQAWSTWESPTPDVPLGVEFAPWDRRTSPGQVLRHKRTDYMVDRTLEFLQKNQGAKPSFITLWPDDPHTPHRPGPEMAKKYGASDDEKKTPKKNVLAVLEEFDRSLGRLFDGLTSMSLDSNTIVIFTADNGPEPRFDGLRTRGLRGQKLGLYEGGVRVPFIVRWPGKVKAGAVDKTSVVSGLDMFPTLCELAGVSVPDEVVKNLDGQSMAGAFKGAPVVRGDTLFWEYGRKPTKVFGYPGVAEHRSPNLAALKAEYKLLVNDDGTSREVYHVVDDPNETKNLAEENIKGMDALTSETLAWRRGLPEVEVE